MESTPIIENEWQYVLNMMPPDLEDSAVEKLALRRNRRVASPGDLLRLALCYGLCDLSLRETAMWAQVQQVAVLSAPALYKRLRAAAPWLGHLVLRWLQERGLPTNVPQLAVRVLDATSISRPGSQGTDWRVHLGLDLGQMRMRTVELTQAREGETFRRHRMAPGEVALADAGYAHPEGVAGVLRDHGHVVVRINWQNFPLETAQGVPLDIVGCLELLGPAEMGDWEVQFRVGQQVYPVRLVALRTSQAAAARARQRLQRTAARKGRRVDPRGLRAAHFVYIITDLPRTRLPAHEALELYRLRWQIEMAFKRLKGIVHLGQLPAKDAQLAAAYLYAKLLGALIVDELSHGALAFSPWGYALLPAAHQPLAGAACAH